MIAALGDDCDCFGGPSVTAESNRPFLLAFVRLHLAFKTFSGWKSNFLKEEGEGNKKTARNIVLLHFVLPFSFPVAVQVSVEPRLSDRLRG